jgi:SAM-dependent methyltransferase
MGPCEAPRNPSGLPDSLPFEYRFDAEIGALIQCATPQLLEVLDKAYRAGQLIGTPLSDTTFGKPYADDFFAFIEEAATPGNSRALEIGAGVGYITHRLMKAGWNATGIEPGKGYASHWKAYGVNIINDFFPSLQVRGLFDLICSYAVLEHIPDPVAFLSLIRSKLSHDGTLVLSVPDCTEEITTGDPSILLHEHFTYFNAETLAKMLWRAGFLADVRKSGYGRCLYAIAQQRTDRRTAPRREDLELLESYPLRADNFIMRMRGKLSKLADQGSLGIYCPARALCVLEPTLRIRFFDDDHAQQGKYLPPFMVAIEGRSDLFASPVDHLAIMSRTFGKRIRDSLRHQGYPGSIVTLDEI